MQFTIDSLRREVEVLRKYDAEIILDIRQETNNSLEKMNGWIAFWIATSCLVCMVVPLIIQLVNWHQNKDQIEKIKLQIEREQEKINILQFHTNLQVGNDHKFKLWGHNNSYAQTMWIECLIGLETAIHDILDQSKTVKHKEKVNLITLLLQLIGYIRELQRWAVPHRVRYIETLNDNAQKLYTELTQDKVYKSEDLRVKFDEIFKDATPLLNKISELNR